MAEGLARLPTPRSIAPLGRLSVSEAPLARRCALRVVLGRDDLLRTSIPTSAAQLLGTAAHLTLQRLESCFQGEQEAGPQTSDVAASTFDSWVDLLREQHAEDARTRAVQPADAEIAGEELPFHRLQRARLSRRAVDRFGPRWRGRFPAVGPKSHPGERGRGFAPLHDGVSCEVPLQSQCGRLIGTADRIVNTSAGTCIEELKTGRLDQEGLLAASQQVKLYGFLLHEASGQWPSRLSVRSLSGDETKIESDPGGLRREAEETLDLLGHIDAILGNASSFAEAADQLASIGTSTCPGCPHRPWCPPYWSDRARFPGDNRADLSGRVESVEGLLIRLTDVYPASVPAEVLWNAELATPKTGESVRICSAFVPARGPLRLDSRSTVWADAGHPK